MKNEYAINLKEALEDLERSGWQRMDDKDFEDYMEVYAKALTREIRSFLKHRKLVQGLKNNRTKGEK